MGTRLRLFGGAIPLAAVCLAMMIPAVAHAAPTVTLVRDTQLDPTAIYFVSFDGLVNNESFQLSIR